MFSQRQNEIIVGSLLGDGCIVKKSCNQHSQYGLTINQSTEDNSGVNKRDYIEFFGQEFAVCGYSIKERTTKPRGLLKRVGKKDEYYTYVFRTKYNRCWQDIEQQWYVPRTDHHFFKRRKIVPVDIVLTPLTTCIWYMDDGCNCSKDANITMSTNGFSKDEVEFLIERLRIDLNIASNLTKDGNNQPRIYIGRKSYFNFIDTIKPHVQWNCFKYKIDTSLYNKKPKRGETHFNAKLTEDQVREIFKLNEDGMSQREIAEKFSVCSTLIPHILSGRLWGHITGVARRSPRKCTYLTEDQRAEVLSMIHKGVYQYEIAKIFNIDQTTVSKIYCREKLKDTLCQKLT